MPLSLPPLPEWRGGSKGFRAQSASTYVGRQPRREDHRTWCPCLLPTLLSSSPRRPAVREQQSMQVALYLQPWGANPCHELRTPSCPQINNLLHAGCKGAGAGQKEGWYPGMLSVRGRSCFVHILLSDSWGSREVERDTLAKRVLAGMSSGLFPICGLACSSAV